MDPGIKLILFQVLTWTTLVYIKVPTWYPPNTIVHGFE